MNIVMQTVKGVIRSQKVPGEMCIERGGVYARSIGSIVGGVFNSLFFFAKGFTFHVGYPPVFFG